MGISKKLRFEVFKRDGFKCCYCGKEPPLVVLEVDHIDPKSKGGNDDINNLLTACFDCNRGKRNIPLDKSPLKLQENLEVLKEKEQQLKEYRKFITKIERRENNDVEDINNIYKEQYHGWEFADHFKEVSLKKFLRSLPKHSVADALRISINKFPKNRDKVIQYFCGVCWNKIKGLS